MEEQDLWVCTLSRPVGVSMAECQAQEQDVDQERQLRQRKSRKCFGTSVTLGPGKYPQAEKAYPEDVHLWVRSGVIARTGKHHRDVVLPAASLSRSHSPH